MTFVSRGKQPVYSGGQRVRHRQGLRECDCKVRRPVSPSRFPANSFSVCRQERWERQHVRTKATRQTHIKVCAGDFQGEVQGLRALEFSHDQRRRGLEFAHIGHD